VLFLLILLVSIVDAPPPPPLDAERGQISFRWSSSDGGGMQLTLLKPCPHCLGPFCCEVVTDVHFFCVWFAATSGTSFFLSRVMQSDKISKQVGVPPPK
jgi:hypothetical protein